MSIFCRLCVRVVSNDDAELVKDIPKDIFAALSINPNLEENSNSVICRECYKRLLGVFEFKSTCMRTDATIISCINGEDRSRLDFQGIYLRGVENKNTVMLSEDEKVCRLCMQLAGNVFVPLQEMDLTGLHRLLPEIQVNISKDPVVCKSCFESCTTHNHFLKDCLDITTEDSELSRKVCEWDQPLLNSVIKMEEIEIKSYDEIEVNKTEIDENVRTCIKAEDIKKETEKTSSTTLTTEIYPVALLISKRQPKPFKTSAGETNFKVCPNNNRMTQKEPFEVKMYKCDTCDYETRYKSNFKIHQLKHKGLSQLYKCDACEFNTKFRSSLKRHQLKHEDNSQMQMYKCEVCSYESMVKGNVKMHQLSHKDRSQVQMYECDTCKYKTKFKSSLQRHQLRHKDPSQVQMYECNTCDYETKTKDSLKKHLLTHKDPFQVQMYKCDTCDYETRYKSNFKIHQLKHKDLSQMYKCDACEFKTKFKSSLKRHQVKHADTSQMQRYKCEVCNYESTVKGNVKMHQLCHKDRSQVQMYECDICDYETRYRNNFKKHQSKHKGPSQAHMYKCDTCDYGTMCRSNFKKHQLKHKDPSQVQLYKCDTCDLETRYKENLKKHRLKCKHPSKVQKY